MKDRGGIVVVQDPHDAAVPSMPSHVIDEVGADHIAPATTLGALLGQLARLTVSDEATMRASADDPARRVHDAELERELRIGALDDDAHSESERFGVPSRFACPDCGGVMWDTSRGGSPLQMRCETGHAYSAESFAEEQTEAALWAAIRAVLRSDGRAGIRPRADRMRESDARSADD